MFFDNHTSHILRLEFEFLERFISKILLKSIILVDLTSPVKLSQSIGHKKADFTQFTFLPLLLYDRISLIRKSLITTNYFEAGLSLIIFYQNFKPILGIFKINKLKAVLLWNNIY